MMKRFLYALIFCIAFYGRAFASPPERIVSLAPSVTEMLYALGLGNRIAAVTNFCDYPPEARLKPKIGGMLNPSLEAILTIKPDVAVMAADGNPAELEGRLEKLGIKVIVFRAKRIAELPQAIRELGAALDVREKADKIAQRIETGIRRIKSNAEKSFLYSHGGKVVFIIWPEPLIVAGPGTPINDAINLLGWKNIASDAKTSYPKYSLEDIILRSPDVILIGTGHVNMIDASKRLLKRLSMLDAVKKGRVYYMSDALYRLGPRTIKGIEELSSRLNEEQKVQKRN
ncbi:MAG: cobalamin-binding protein [Nitrospiraceae bacterium]|nr:cobalamin-binding protein [Nitrospiraceae bacterium]